MNFGLKEGVTPLLAGQEAQVELQTEITHRLV